MSTKKEEGDNGIILREHKYDGIQEYDQRLPNWWLFTLYGAIVFSFVYWFYEDQSGLGIPDTEVLETSLQAIETAKLENSIDVTNNDLFVQMSANSDFVAAGARTYSQSCVACHGANLEGGIGQNLVDSEWKHGGEPTQIYTSIYDGIPEMGMQAWGNLLGQKKIAELVAFILSKQEGQ